LNCIIAKWPLEARATVVIRQPGKHGAHCRRYVEDGVLDCGICGRDWIVETGADVVEVCELQYSKVISDSLIVRFRCGK
jgi:ATP phosphoribosyltransferase